MSRSHESGAYLGGIGTMLSQVETCPTCGHAHREGVRPYVGLHERDCPEVVVGALPYILGQEFEVRTFASETSDAPVVGHGSKPRKVSVRDSPLALWPPLIPLSEVVL